MILENSTFKEAVREVESKLNTKKCKDKDEAYGVYLQKQALNVIIDKLKTYIAYGAVEETKVKKETKEPVFDRGF